ncbi:hypothetical protein AKJ16_DCAP00058 [Drosera capensis]
MSLHSSSDQDFCSILVLTDEDTADKQCEAHLSLSTYVEVQESQMCLDAHLNCKNVVDSGKDGATKYSPCMVYVDVEKGNSGSCKINEETGGRLKAEMALTKALRRQNSLQTSSTPVAPLMNQILMLLNFDDKDKATVEKPHDTPTNKWRKYKRAASFDSRQIVSEMANLNDSNFIGSTSISFHSFEELLDADGIAWMALCDLYAHNVTIKMQLFYKIDSLFFREDAESKIGSENNLSAIYCKPYNGFDVVGKQRLDEMTCAGAETSRDRKSESE